MFLIVRCHIVNQFNEGLYDYIIAADETVLENPSQKTDKKKQKPKYFFSRFAKNIWLRIIFFLKSDSVTVSMWMFKFCIDKFCCCWKLNVNMNAFFLKEEERQRIWSVKRNRLSECGKCCKFWLSTKHRGVYS